MKRSQTCCHRHPACAAACGPLLYVCGRGGPCTRSEGGPQRGRFRSQRMPPKGAAMIHHQWKGWASPPPWQPSPRCSPPPQGPSTVVGLQAAPRGELRPARRAALVDCRPDGSRQVGGHRPLADPALSLLLLPQLSYRTRRCAPCRAQSPERTACARLGRGPPWLPLSRGPAAPPSPPAAACAAQWPPRVSRGRGCGEVPRGPSCRASLLPAPQLGAEAA
mmetsp:Transcript_5085/g.14189  ORF Transcript_5085/g.14189 Transcript_5085/m.14189 type:complete len:220 (+) Transcript_5085:1084-1743(+)